MVKQYSKKDFCIWAADNLIKCFLPGRKIFPASPADTVEENKLSPSSKQRSQAMMRVNHAGEVSAQALYIGQALFARQPKLQEDLLAAAEEEQAHLDWCAQRIEQLDSHRSYLNPLWASGSFIVGGLAALAGDKYSLGFLAETENQVGQHLKSHLKDIDVHDHKSIAIIQQMIIDEAKHEGFAIQSGGTEFSKPVKSLMRLTSKALTYGSWWV